MVHRVNVARDEVGAVCVGPGDEHRRHAHDVGGEPGGDEVPYALGRRQEDLAAHVAALLFRGKLVLEVDAGCAGLDHTLHQLEDVQRAAETGLGVGDYRGEPVDAVLTFGVVDLVCPLQRLVDPLDHVRHAVRRVQTLVRVHLARQVRIRRNLPTGEVDRLQAGLHLLHRLVARQRTESIDVVLAVHQVPEPLRAEPGQRVLDLYGPPQLGDVLRAVRALDAFPALTLPTLLYLLNLSLPVLHHLLLF